MLSTNFQHNHEAPLAQLVERGTSIPLDHAEVAGSTPSGGNRFVQLENMVVKEKELFINRGGKLF